MGQESFLNSDSIRRAAEELLAEHGPDALDKANSYARELRDEGYETLAQTWDLISAGIEDLTAHKGMRVSEETKTLNGQTSEVASST